MDEFLQASIVISEFGRREGEKILALASVLNVILKNGQKVIAFGNGGSAAEASHFVAELIGRFNGKDKGYPAIALNDPTLLTSIANDYGFDRVFSKQIEAIAEYGDMVIGFSTSGTSVNVLNGLYAARLLGMPTALITGDRHADLTVADFVIRSPSIDVARIQECHLVFIHHVCKIIKECE